LLHAPNPALTASYGGLVNGDTPASLSGTLSCTTTATTASPVGSYPIPCSGQPSNNYNMTCIPGILKILYASTGICDGDAGHQIRPPINANGSTVGKLGRTIPAKFRVCDANGVSIGTPGVVQNFMLVQITGGTVADMDESVASTTPDTAFRSDSSGQQWIFNIDTGNLKAGQTYVYSIQLNDGSAIGFAYGLR
jgi:MBG domain (YGX type)